MESVTPSYSGVSSPLSSATRSVSVILHSLSGAGDADYASELVVPQWMFPLMTGWVRPFLLILVTVQTDRFDGYPDDLLFDRSQARHHSQVRLLCLHVHP